MREVETANRSRRIHCETLGELDARVPLRLEEIEKMAHLSVVGRSRIARRGANSSVTLLEQFVMAELFFAAEAPRIASAFVHELGQSLGQTIREGLGHQSIVVVIVLLELFNQRLDLNSGGDSKCAEVVLQLRFFRRDEIGQ